MTFNSPIVDAENWNCEITAVTVPEGFRYPGVQARAIRTKPAAGNTGDVATPAASVLRKTNVAPDSVIEIELNPFPIQDIARKIARKLSGLPTFYIFFDTPQTWSFSDGDYAQSGELLGTVGTVEIAAVFPDRIVREPALWAKLIHDILTTTGEESASWQGFLNRLTEQTEYHASSALLLLDHTGQPLEKEQQFQVVLDPDGAAKCYPVTLHPNDGGDLQVAIKLANNAGTLDIDSLWGNGATSALLRPLPETESQHFQLTILEDNDSKVGEIEVTPARRHVIITNFSDWFEEQYTANAGLAENLQWYTRGNTFEPLIDGNAYFRDLFQRLHEARSPAGGLHLAGWWIDHDEELAKPSVEDAADFPETIEQAVEQIAIAGGKSRVLGADFLKYSESQDLSIELFLVALSIICAEGVLDKLGAFRTDGSGKAILLLSLLAFPGVLDHLVSGESLEPNDDAIDALNDVTNTSAKFSPYPSKLEDNPALDIDSDWFEIPPLSGIVESFRHFGVYHQKLAIVKTVSGFVGYCGGIDINKNRLDDSRHLIQAPYHDLQAKVTGPAVRDLALTFAQRWARDGDGESLAFDTPALDSLGSPGETTIQVARTYHASDAEDRQLAFAPAGDRTLLNTIKKAIAAAREFIYIEDQYLTPPEEYRDAIFARLEDRSRPIKKLIILVPEVTDQPFGLFLRKGFIKELRDLDQDGIVQVGFPRRRYTVPKGDLRGSSGKLILGEALPAVYAPGQTITLGPKARLPKPPFWVAVDGELIHVSDEASPVGLNDSVRFDIDRGKASRFLTGEPNPSGPTTRKHEVGAAVTLIEPKGINVHSKMMIVDDVFCSVGSANLNRRGFYSDGEVNVFAVPQRLKADPANPVLALRKRLWAEMMDLPYEIAEPLLNDPIASSDLFRRSYFLGNRFVDANATPQIVEGVGFRGGDTFVGFLLQGFLFAFSAAQQEELWDSFVDPTSSLDPKYTDRE